MFDFIKKLFGGLFYFLSLKWLFGSKKSKAEKQPKPIQQANKKTKPEPATVAVAKPVKAEPVVVVAPPAPPQPTEPIEPYASKFLNPSFNPTSRRRPGANMTYFLNLAREISSSN